MTTVALGLDPVFKKFPTISREAQKIADALSRVESGTRLATGFSPYALACQNLISSSAKLRTAHKDLDAALQALSGRVQKAAAKIGPSELLAAIRSDDVKSVWNILRVSSLQNRKLSNGETPLHYAIRSGSTEVAKYLLESVRIDPLSRDHQGLTAFDHAFIKNDKKMVALVLGSALGIQIPESALPAKGDIPEMQLISQEISGLRRPPVSKLPPLHAAAFLDDMQGLEKLAGSDLNAVDANGMTALHYAVLGGRDAAVKWLFAKGAKLEIKAKNGMNLLHFAVVGGSDPLVKRLLDTKKFDPNGGDGRGRTPLHFAIATDKIGVARALIERGGDPFIKTMQMTPFAIFEVVSRVRSEIKDPLRLDLSSLSVLGSFALSAVCHYFGDAKAEGFPKYLSIASKVFSALPVLTTLFKTSRSGGSPMKTIPAQMACYGGLIGYLTDSSDTKTYFEAGHSLYLGKTLIDQLQNSWKNSSLETYRPLRNVLVHTASALFAAYQFMYTSGIKKQIVCKLGTSAQCILQNQVNPKYVKPPECQGLEEGMSDGLIEKTCNAPILERKEKLNGCLDEDTSDLEKTIKGICEKKLPTEDRVNCQGLSDVDCNIAKRKAYQALKNCKETHKDQACEEFFSSKSNLFSSKDSDIFSSKDIDECKAKLKQETQRKGDACELRIPAVEVEDFATCKARLKPNYEALTKICRQQALDTTADANLILGLSGESDPDKAKAVLFKEFGTGEKEVRKKIAQAYETIKNPPPTFMPNPAAMNCTALPPNLDTMTEPEKIGALNPKCENQAEMILGLKAGYTKKDCLKGFRDISRNYHPDKVSDLKLNALYASKIMPAKDLLCP